MQSDFKTIFKYGLSLLLAFALLWYVFREVDVKVLLNEFSQADRRWIALSGLLTIVAHATRAYRWRLLMQPLGYKPSLFHTFLALMTGYFANLFIPRMGEVTRCGMLYKMDKVPVDVAFGTVVAERIIDVLVLFALLCTVFLLEFNLLSSFFLEFFTSKFSGLHHLLQSTPVLVGVIVLAVVLLAGVYFLFTKHQLAIKKNRLYTKVVTFGKGMVEGILSVRKIHSPTAFVAATVVIWVMYYFMSYVLFFAMPQTASLGVRAGFTILIMGGLGMAAPVQGGVGTFHLLVGNALILYGLTQQDGIILATFMHASQTLFIIALGGTCFLLSMLIQKKQSAISAEITNQA